jgi:hypothetical protein
VWCLIALPLLLVGAPLEGVEHRPGGRGLTLLFFVLVLFRLLGLAAALVLARHHCLHSFMSSVGTCGSAIGSTERWVLQADLLTMFQSRPNSDHRSQIRQMPEVQGPSFADVNVAVLISASALREGWWYGADANTAS